MKKKELRYTKKLLILSKCDFMSPILLVEGKSVRETINSKEEIR